MSILPLHCNETAKTKKNWQTFLDFESKNISIISLDLFECFVIRHAAHSDFREMKPLEN